jgi:hypothetical protein
VTYTIRSNRTTNHIEGIGAKTLGDGASEERNSERGHVAYYAENACPSLTRYGRTMSRDKSFETLAEALENARKAGGRRLCMTCEKAAQAELDALVAAVAELEPVEAAPVEGEHAQIMARVADLTARGVWPAAKPAAPVRRAKLRLGSAHASLNERGELVIIAEDAIRGPVEITMDETVSRWLRSCFADMPPLSHDDN